MIAKVKKIIYRGVEIPNWADEKLIDGMQDFIDISQEYEHFGVVFEANDCLDDKDIGFVAKVHCGHGLKMVEHVFYVVWDYEKKWNFYGDRIREWQFELANGDVYREMSVEMFYVEMFYVEMFYYLLRNRLTDMEKTDEGQVVV